MRTSGNKISGFTLIEMIVALGLFSVVAVIALGSLVKIISANQKAQALQATFTNLNFALESMSRELRMGTVYHCDLTPNTYQGSTLTALGCSINDTAVNQNNQYQNPMSTIAFLSSRVGTDPTTGLPCGLATAYRFENISGFIHLQKAEQTACGTPIGDAYGYAHFYDIVSPNDVSLTDYRMGVITTDSVGNQLIYPRVFIRLIGSAGAKANIKTDFDIQTTISQRVRN
ncbi:type II secretion system GspH family protein [Patescibacteria group bacterium]|nr:type II secretion system GspH family protein [Patescibacteria group bacterium]MDE1946750.1 type II secretion system protein [Patescibacteria group bacterium]MDE2010947.1 type II secretion system protein [Patescibacteria group bacterium]MDE2233564.1 type II secretion system protein [Patescibacteria group bacterium]